MKQQAYLASDDSALLREKLRDRSGFSCLEIGAGNGGNLIELAARFELAVGTDLVRPEKLEWRSRPGDFVLADGASCFSDESFDLVAFNPPYLPSETIQDVAVDGGRGGIEVPLFFLKEALRVVKKGGRILMLLSSQNSVEEIRQECSKSSFKLSLVAEKRLFYEKLSVYEASPV